MGAARDVPERLCDKTNVVFSRYFFNLALGPPPSLRYLRSPDEGVSLALALIFQTS